MNSHNVYFYIELAVAKIVKSVDLTFANVAVLKKDLYHQYERRTHVLSISTSTFGYEK